MSRADLRRPSPGRASRRKATLFCPTCGHESHARRGDWVVERRSDDGRRVVSVSCPVCGTTLTTERVYAE